LSIFKGLFSHQVSGIEQQPILFLALVRIPISCVAIGKSLPSSQNRDFDETSLPLSVLIMP
jgi:hypothetical protein